MKVKTIRVLAQAKINLRLKILAREESGYHSIETIFHRIDLADEITLRVKNSGRSLIVTGPELPPDGLCAVEENLAYRAAVLFQKRANWPKGFAIDLVKNVPAGGGLGGGSADAAAILRALNRAAPRHLAHQELMEMALELGSDVPFLTSDSVMALGWGRGERMLQLPPLPQAQVALILPGVPVTTADAYRWASKNLSVRPDILQVSQLSSWNDLAILAGNDFTTPVTLHKPRVRKALKEAQKLAGLAHSHPVVGMSGSGSTIFVIGRGLKTILKHYQGPGRVIWTETSKVVEKPVFS